MFNNSLAEYLAAKILDSELRQRMKDQERLAAEMSAEVERLEKERLVAEAAIKYTAEGELKFVFASAYC